MAVKVLYLFLMVPWVGLQCVILAFPGHTHLLCHMLIESNMRALVLLNLLNSLRKKIKKLTKPGILSLFLNLCNSFNKVYVHEHSHM